MKMRKRRSLATSVRISLLAGAGALGWMALGASGASAAELPIERGLLGSVTDVVETRVAPALTAVTEPAAPLVAATGLQQTRALPLVDDVAARVPQLLSEPVGSVLTPVTTTVDQTIAQVPVVGQIVPTGTVTGITTPVTGIVDGTAGVVVEPVLEVVAPVTDIVAPVVEALPVPVAVPPIAVLPVIDPSSPLVTAPVATAPVATAPVAALPEAPAVGEQPNPLAGAAPSVVAADSRTDVVTVVDAVAAVIPAEELAGSGAIVTPPVPSGPAAEVSVVVEPGLELLLEPFVRGAGAVMTGLVPFADETPGALPAVLSSFSGGTSSMTSAGSAAPPAALMAGASFLFFLRLGGRVHTANVGLPAGPSFDPGSSPD